MYTVLPEKVAGTTKGPGFYYCDIDTKGRTVLTEYIRGGAVYTSNLWDYSPDLVIVRNWFSFTVYAVEKIQQPGSNIRHIVALCPKATVHMPHWLYAFFARPFNFNWSRTPMLDYDKSVSKVQSGYVIRRYVDSEGIDTLSIRNHDIKDGHCMTVPHSLYYSLTSYAKNNQKYFGLSTIERAFSIDKLAISQSDIRMLAELISNNINQKYSVPQQMVNYQCSGRDEFADAKPVAHLVHPPITDDVAVAPIRSYNNDVACITKRIDDIANDTTPPHRFEKYKQEFLDMLVPANMVGRGCSVDAPVVYEKQDNPRQKARNNVQLHNFANHSRSVKSFQKSECGKLGGAPRNISTVDASLTVDLSMYTMAFKEDVMVKQSWYMPGLKPDDMATRITDYVRRTREKGKVVIETDYTKFDGSISPWLRQIEFEAMRRWVSPTKLPHLNKLLIHEINNKGITTQGVKYQTRSTRLSGSPLTTIGNTIVNAFVAYATYRESHTGTSRKHVKRCWDLIGPKYGDDGLDQGANFVEVGKILGLTIKIDERNDWVTFCGRAYINPMHTISSVTPCSRVLRKIPVVTNNDSDGGRNKVLGYLVTDSMTPVVGQYLRALARVYNYNGEVDANIIQDRDLAHRVRNGAYSFLTQDTDRAISFMAQDMGVTPEDIVRISEKLDAVKVARDFIGITVGCQQPINESLEAYLVC
jgi:hypothetical protein